MKRLIVLLLGLAMTTTACSESSPRNDALTILVDKYIVPSYQVANDKANVLVERVNVACTGTPESLKSANEALVAAREAWGKTEAVWLGPVMTDRISSQVDYATDPAKVDQLISNQSIQLTTDEVLRKSAANQRGLGALEYAMNSGPMTDQRRCDFAKANAGIAQQGTKKAADAWANGYRATFLEDPDMSLDDLVNDSVNLLHMLGEAEIESALGTAKRKANIAALREGPTGAGVPFYKARLEGAKAVMVGNADQPGLSELLGADLLAKLTREYDEALQALSAINGSMAAAVANDRPAVEKAQVAISEIHTLESTEVISKLGVTAGFSDSDGDSTG